MRFRISIHTIRPSGHELKDYSAEFGCVNAGRHKKDILAFLEQLETECPEHMKRPVKARRESLKTEQTQLISAEKGG